MSRPVAKRAKIIDPATQVSPDKDSLLLYASTTEDGNIELKIAGVKSSSIPFSASILKEGLKAFLLLRS
jgi:hypothetical protein